MWIMFNYWILCFYHIFELHCCMPRSITMGIPSSSYVDLFYLNRAYEIMRMLHVLLYSNQYICPFV